MGSFVNHFLVLALVVLLNLREEIQVMAGVEFQLDVKWDSPLPQPVMVNFFPRRALTTNRVAHNKSIVLVVIEELFIKDLNPRVEGRLSGVRHVVSISKLATAVNSLALLGLGATCCCGTWPLMELIKSERESCYSIDRSTGHCDPFEFHERAPHSCYSA